MRVVSDVDGALHRLLLWFPREAALRPGYRTAYAELLTSLPVTTQLTVFVHPEAAADLRALIAAGGRRDSTTVIPASGDLRFTVWARDPAITLRDHDGGVSFLAPTRFNRQQDASAVAQLARAIGAPVNRTAACPPGGDVLIGDDFVLGGRDALRAAAGNGGTGSTSRAAERLRTLLDPRRQVIVLGSDRPPPSSRTRERRVGTRDVLELLPGGPAGGRPLQHLDTFVTLAGHGDHGRARVLVGSSRLADELLDRAPIDPALDAHFDEVATQLADGGFEVIRNPLPLTYGYGRRRIEGVMRDVRLWYLATANNALVQFSAAEGDRVWLPTYGHGAWQELAVTDAANRRIWEQLGVTVHELTSYHAFAQRFGALRCITQVLERTAS